MTNLINRALVAEKKLFFILFAVLISVSTWAGEPCFEIKSNITHDLNVTVNDLHGMRFNIPADVLNFKGKKVRWFGTLFYKNNKGEWVGVPFSHKTSNEYNCTNDVTIGTSPQQYYCSSDFVYNNYMVFLPYHAITHPSGHVDYKFTIWAREADNASFFLKNKNGGYLHDYFFSLKWPNDWPTGQTKVPASTATSKPSTPQSETEKAFIQGFVNDIDKELKSLSDKEIKYNGMYIEGKDIICSFIVDESEYSGMTILELFRPEETSETSFCQMFSDALLSDDMNASVRAELLRLKSYGYKLYVRLTGNNSRQTMTCLIDYESKLK